MHTDIVADKETLYRRVPNHPGNFKVENGQIRVSSAAFGDRAKMQPSVDRAFLRKNNPENSKLNADDLIVSLVAGDVRSKISSQVPRIIDGIQQSCKVDVIADLLETNSAHALIRAIPNFKVEERNIFERKFRKALARLATREIPPEEIL